MEEVSRRVKYRLKSKSGIKVTFSKNGEIKFLTMNYHLHRRWFVLTKTHVLSFAEERVYKNPTEVIPMSSCQTVKSVEEEINKQNAFLSAQEGDNHCVFLMCLEVRS